MASVEPEIAVVNFLKANLTDPNSSRVGSDWIYPDFPRTQDLSLNSFPRIGVTKLTESAQPIGLFDDIVLDKIAIQIDVVTKKDLVLSITVTDESLGTISNSPRLQLMNRPFSVTNIKHNTVAFGTVSLVNTDSDFTSPSAGTVQVSKSTGKMNFNSTDLTTYAGQTITSTYVLKLEGDKLCSYLARKVVRAFRTQWRTSAQLSPYFYPVKLNSSIIPFEEENGIFRRVIEYDLQAFNAGEGE